MDAVFVMTSNLGQREIADEAVRVRAQMTDAKDPDAIEPIQVSLAVLNALGRLGNHSVQFCYGLKSHPQLLGVHAPNGCPGGCQFFKCG